MEYISGLTWGGRRIWGFLVARRDYLPQDQRAPATIGGFSLVLASDAVTPPVSPLKNVSRRQALPSAVYLQNPESLKVFRSHWADAAVKSCGGYRLDT